MNRLRAAAISRGGGLLALAVCLALGAVAAGGAEQAATGVTGKVLFEGKPAAGIRVHAFADAAGGFAGSGAASGGPTGEDGRFTLLLEPGRYFLVAKQAAGGADAEPAPGSLFGYYGGNPVKVVAGSTVEANLQVVRRAPVTISQGASPGVTIEGVVTGPRGPESGAVLFAYPDATSDFRGPDLTGPQGSLLGGTGPDGKFSVELPAGTYFLAAARRKGGGALGPLQVGDLHGYFDGNPLTLRAGQKAMITVQLTEKLRQAEVRAVPAAGSTGVRGRILDPAGKPVPGVFAFATTDPNLIGAMPPHRSRPVGGDGAYFIELPRGGTYYVGARTGFGGVPMPGQWQGMLGDANIRSITVETGRVIDGVDITVRVVE
ncbi:MAG TPA: hypothetical protein VI078_06760 [bacterium]